MPRQPASRTLVVNRPLDLKRIDAVGFDLDHTLAIYDDPAVNALAMAEAQGLLVEERGYRREDVDVAPSAHDFISARALGLDLTSAHVVKLDADRRVRVARRARSWLGADEIARAHPASLPLDAVHPLSSAFDVPTMWLFEAVVRQRASALDGDATLARRICRDVREMLDWSHTRGELKRRLTDDLARFVAPVVGATERLREWRRAGKSLFVVTNSEPAFATAVLELAVGPQWRDLFVVVSTSSRKPAFFGHDTSAPPANQSVVEGSHARRIEDRVGARGERVLYVGDNARADIEAARAFGWRTVHIVAEMANDGPSGEGWGSPFLAGDLRSWFARMVDECGDVACARVDGLLALDPEQYLG